MNKRLCVDLPGIKLKNPIMPASGCFGFGIEFSNYYNLSELGAIMIKAVTKEPRFGNDIPRIAETSSGMLNAIGLQNPGIDYVLNNQLKELEKYDVPIIANVAGNSIEEYVYVSKKICMANNVKAIELNISCPNVKIGGIQFGTNPDIAYQLVKEVKKNTNKPVYVKLSPSVTDIKEMAIAVEKAGADAITLINTLTGMVLDYKSGKPILANKVGGLSGPAIKPIAIRMVYEVAQIVNIPIIGMGGISNVKDVIDFISAGATAVAIGTANFDNPYICINIINEIEKELDNLNVFNILELRGRSWK